MRMLREEQNTVATARFTLAEYKRLTTDLTDAQLDSLIAQKGYLTGFFTRKGVRVLVSLRDATPKEIFNQLLRGTSIMLFLLMPLAALLLQLAYYRRRRHYVSHLVFTVHTHCLLFVYIALLLVLMQSYSVVLVVAGLTVGFGALLYF
ncbi:hypothetical protein I2I05_01585 [Hymenobacter sp. BT683]|uniref:Uncharacterized protein n=1 Tax=Hymenobacter jeongseonensis TaxID=2791027 RepID=A0ABS0IDY8_9BACT|nr:hypothetical protein [Hymenobacter jeongseonensis]MBF9236075.1 hypothetical protein [Hymenobacter jeongseonensis]